MRLEIESLTMAYGGLKVVDNLSFAMPAGDIVGVIGPNGAGKSTMFSIVTGFLVADAGDVRLGGETVTALSPVARAKSGMVRTLGRALMTGAKLILLDEPFAGVNPVLIEEISQRIRELNADGVGFLIIEHDLGALTRIVSTLHVMDRGRLIASGGPAEVLKDPVVREAYLGGVS